MPEDVMPTDLPVEAFDVEEEPERGMFDDEPPVWEEDFLKPAVPAVADEEDATKEVVPTDEVQETPVAQAEVPVPTDDQRDAAYFSQLQERVQSNPVQALQELAEILQVDLKGLQGNPVNEEDALVNDEDLTIPEKLVWEKRDFLRNAPNVMESMGKNLNETRALSEFSSVVANAQMQALAEALGFELPDISADIQAIIQDVNANKPIREAVSKHYKPKLDAQVQKYKQAKTPKPRTPVVTTNAPTVIPKGATMRDILRLQKSG